MFRFIVNDKYSTVVLPSNSYFACDANVCVSAGTLNAVQNQNGGEIGSAHGFCIQVTYHVALSHVAS